MIYYSFESFDEAIKKELKDKFGNKVFFDLQGICKVGTLVGIEINSYGICYIIDDLRGIRYHVPITKSLTIV